MSTMLCYLKRCRRRAICCKSNLHGIMKFTIYTKMATILTINTLQKCKLTIIVKARTTSTSSISTKCCLLLFAPLFQSAESFTFWSLTIKSDQVYCLRSRFSNSAREEGEMNGLEIVANRYCALWIERAGRRLD
jgi:hypothetical protein